MTLQKVVSLSLTHPAECVNDNCHEKITLVIEGRSFKDGIMQEEIAAEITKSEHNI